MPDLPNENRRKKVAPEEEARRIAHVQKSLGQGLGRLSRGREGRQKNDPGTNLRGLGCEAAAALELWYRFASHVPDFRLTGNREFRSDLELIEIIENEEVSLNAFCRSRHLDGAALLGSLAAKGIEKSHGSEHDVYVDRENGLVYKATRDGRYGRKRDTPSQYIERLSLMNAIVPVLEIQFEDFLQSSNEGTIITSMPFFPGRHPSPEEVDDYLVVSGFEPFSDQSGTIDYLHRVDGLIFRDCHSANWVVFQDKLIPIDIIPGWLSHVC
jgi:hypothetical protein